MDLLAQIEEDIDSGSAPLKSVDELYRDKIHMNVITGRYLMHNSMRLALSQKTSAAGFEKLDPELRTYFEDASENFDMWLEKIRTDDVKKALQAALDGKVPTVYDSYYEGFIPPRRDKDGREFYRDDRYNDRNY